MAGPAVIDTARRVARDGTGVMLAGTVVAGVATYAWQVAGTRVLGEVEFAPVATVWTLMFLMITVLLAPVEQFAIRTVAAEGGGRSRLTAALPTLVGLAAAAAVVVASLTWALRGSLFAGNAAYVPVCVALLLAFGQLALIRGVVAGQRDFAAYGWITGLDSCLRLLIGVPLLLAGGSALALAWTVPVCPLVALAWARRPPTPPGAVGDAAAAPASLTRFIAHTVGGTIPSQIILAAGPLLVAVLSRDQATVTTLFVTQTAFRAVFLLATPGWSRALPTLTRIAMGPDASRLGHVSRLVMVATLVVAGVGGAAAAVGAPPLIALLFGAGVRPSSIVAGLTMAATLGAVGNLGLNTVLEAGARTASITVVWWMALIAAAVLVAVVPGEPSLRVVVAFAGGEFVALVGLGLAASGSRPSAGAAPLVVTGPSLP